MAGTTSRPPAAGAVTALTVHGPRGVLDLTVPTDATLADVARAYAEGAGLPAPLPFVTPRGEPLQMTTEVGAAGLVSGSLLVAVDPAARPAPPRRGAGPAMSGPALVPGAASGTWLTIAVAVAVLAGWSTSRLPEADRWPAVAVLVAAALLGCLPFGALAVQRVIAAPAFAAAAAFAVVWSPQAERLPTVLGTAALAGAIAAAVGRALIEPGSAAEEALRTWLVVGAGCFVVASVGALTSTSPQVVWAVLFLVAVLGARFVPEFAVDVPDQYLLDLERLAVTAWSARERPTGRRGRVVVPEHAINAVAARGTRTIRAAAVAIFVVVLVAAPLLLWSADLPLDRTGARCLVGFGGASLLFAARSYRHVVARRFLRLSGVVALGLVAAAVLGLLPGVTGVGIDRPGVVAPVAIGIAAVLVLVAVLVGRGWRSAWWSRRAEVGESLSGAFTVASLVVAVGFFRYLWELTS
ncbi:hypothetical protein ASE01_02470 [Nocardioides sp. Root190]|uniref:hypothetical protein n=1 Tax=Nocardioides sp. Root190 TaxID=1736488 RepID=UPI000701F39D|nr:hypothetical protein [Nocardioides sp. Root190]KRB80364.1 hypothetical protein ASE01_02470 [Nocardioides sp. Root190]